jgi:formylmethanofuran dehydrogenase subunit E
MDVMVRTRTSTPIGRLSEGQLASPAVVCIRGPSRSGKTELIRRLIETLRARGVSVAYLKRTHHPLDLPGKGSARVWQSNPAAMVIHGVDRVQLTFPAGSRDAPSLLSHVPADVDLVLLETHNPEPFPTILARGVDAAEGEEVIGRWALCDIDAAVATLTPALVRLLPSDCPLARSLRSAVALHGGHACPGLILGTRLALAGAEALGVEVPDRTKRLKVVLETDRCAADAVQAVTGCRLGQRTLRLLDYGKLAATFTDQSQGWAVRVAVRGDLRDRVADMCPAGGREALLAAYATMTPPELFDFRSVVLPPVSEDSPRVGRRHVRCTACGEEVSDRREVDVDGRLFCRPCAAARLEGAGCTGRTTS